MLSICGEIILSDVSNCSETNTFLILCDVSIFFFFFKEPWVGSLSFLFFDLVDLSSLPYFSFKK